MFFLLFFFPFCSSNVKKDKFEGHLKWDVLYCFSELLVKEDGTLVAEGNILLRPKMAVTLQRIADDPLAFYDPTSQLAQDIVADIAEYGTIL